MKLPANEPDPAGQLIERARVLLQLGRPAEALPLLQQAVAAAPGDCNPQCWMSLALMRLGRLPEALKAAERGVALAPEYEWPHRLRSLVLTEQGKLRPALEAAREAVRLAPDDETALHLLANCEIDCKQYSQAQATVERLLKVSPEWADAHTLMGVVMLHFKRWDEAEEQCRRALELDPEARTPLYNLGYIRQKTGRKREAADYYHAVLRLHPGDAQARRALLLLVDRDMSELPIWLRKKRLEQEDPAVQAFVTEAQQRSNREVAETLAVGWVLFGWIMSLGWSGLIISFLWHGGLMHHWWGWAAYGATLLATVWGTVLLIRKKQRQGH
jgi:tetratricopeptide (TPR) repeat protein